MEHYFEHAFNIGKVKFMSNGMSQPRRRENNTNTQPRSKQKEAIDHSHLPLRKAKMKFFNHDRGFGFVKVQQDDGSEKECFVHISTLIECGIDANDIGNDTELLVKHLVVPKGDQVLYAQFPEATESA